MNELLKALACRSPDEIVVSDENQTLTVSGLLAEVEMLRAELLTLGVRRLALLADNSAAWLITDLACQSAGICLLPLPGFFAKGQLTHALKAAGIDSILTDDLIRAQGLTEVTDMNGRASLLAGKLQLVRLPDPLPAALPKGTAKITFTSGSTGTPRGVCLSTGQQLRVARALRDALDLDRPVHLCLVPLSTLLENIGGIYFPLLSAGRVVVPPIHTLGFSGGNGLDMRKLLRAIQRHRPTSIILLPQMLVGLVAALKDGWRPPGELRFAAVGGAKVSPGLILRARESGLPVYEGYGLSETASVACLNIPGAERIGSVGRPLSHVDVSVSDGEVVIAGNAFLGYVDDPAGWGATEIHTGDLGEFDADGYLYLHGRRKNLLISSYGRNISPEWVESELLRHPLIHQCVVFGDARPFCSALIVPAQPEISDPVIEAAVQSVNDDLPPYAQVRSWYRLEKPLDSVKGLYTDNGRPRRTLIAKHYEQIIDGLYAGSPRSAVL